MSKQYQLEVLIDNEPYYPQHLAERGINVDNDSDNECPPPPPTPSPKHHVVATLTPLSLDSPLPSPPPFTNITNDEKIYNDSPSTKNQEEIALRFYRYVLLMKCMCGWNEHIVMRKKMIGSSKQLLKRILFKWMAHIDEVKIRRNRITVLSRLLEIVRRRALKVGMVLLHAHYSNSAFVETIFLSWRELTLASNHGRTMKEAHAIFTMSLFKTRAFFQKWRSETILNTLVDSKRHSMLSIIVQHWHHIAKQSRNDWIIKMELIDARIDAKNLELLKKLFQSLWLYASKKKRYRYTFYQAMYKRAEEILQTSIKSWRVYHKLMKQRRNVIIKIVKRRNLMNWRFITKTLKQREYISIQIIFNRWKCIVDDRLYKRERIFNALNHRVKYLYKLVMISWKKVLDDAKGRLRTPPASLYKMPHIFTSEHYLKKTQYTKRQPSCVHQESVRQRRHFTSKFGGLVGYCHRNRPKYSIRSHGKITRQHNFNTIEFGQSRNSTFSSFKHDTFPQHKREILENFNATTSPSSFLDRMSQQRNFSLGSQRPIEYLMTGRVGSERKQSVPPWILNYLSSREGTRHYCSNSNILPSTVNNEVLYSAPAEPKFSYPTSKNFRNGRFSLSKEESYMNEDKAMPHK